MTLQTYRKPTYAGKSRIYFYPLYQKSQRDSVTLQSTGDSRDAKQQNADKDKNYAEVKVALGILAYNYEAILEEIITPLKGVVDDIIVCDNCSTDQTAKTAIALGCKVVAPPEHSEDGIALKFLFDYALKSNLDALIVLDHGAQIYGPDAEKLMTTLLSDDSDIVLGTKHRFGFARHEEKDNFHVITYGKKAIAKMFVAPTNESGVLGASRKMNLKVSTCNVTSKSRLAELEAPSSAEADPSTLNLKSVSLGKTRRRRRSISLSFLFKDIWFLRSLTLISGMIVGALLLAYSLIFWDTFLTVGDTTSYFPWSWHVLYTNSGLVTNYFVIGLAISIVPLVASALVLLRWVMPPLRTSLAIYAKRAQISPE